MNKLLIQACSGRKIPSDRPLPAIELYDGAAFRVIKKFSREKPDESRNLEMLILSAEYGLICAATKISPYDRRMTEERALKLQLPICEAWQKFTGGKSFESIYVNVGRAYLPALALIDFADFARFASGGIGTRNGQLKQWLWR